MLHTLSGLVAGPCWVFLYRAMSESERALKCNSRLVTISYIGR